MTDKKKKSPEKLLYSLRSELLLLILVGVMIATGSYFLVHSIFVNVVDNVYLTEEKRSDREIKSVMDLQAFVNREKLTSSSVDKIGQWQEKNQYLYVLVYTDDGEVVYSSNRGLGNTQGISAAPFPAGISVELPREDELRAYAEAHASYPLIMKDGSLFVSVADFKEYFYYDIANITSLLTALVAIALIMIFFVRKIVLRITHLAGDVSVVADGNMEHEIYFDNENDEISSLSKNIENMRTSLISTLENERAAVSANNELITSMSHDIRTPLTVLLGYLDLMKAKNKDDCIGGYITTAEKTTLRLKELSDDLFQYFTVFSSSDPEVNAIPCDAETLYDQMLTEHVVLLSEQGYLVKYEALSLTGGAREIVTDVPKVRRIIDNFFSNVKKYAEKNEPISIRVTDEDGKIILRIVNTVSRFNDRVESNGIGMRTCEKLTRVLGGELFFEERDGKYCITFTLPHTKEEKV